MSNCAIYRSVLQDFDLAVFATIIIIKYYIVKKMPIRAMLTLLVSQTATVEY